MLYDTHSALCGRVRVTLSGQRMALQDGSSLLLCSVCDWCQRYPAPYKPDSLKILQSAHKELQHWNSDCSRMISWCDDLTEFKALEERGVEMLITPKKQQQLQNIISQATQY